MNQQEASVQYKSNAIVITIATPCPAATHRNLLRGITDALQYYVNSLDKKDDTQGLLTLLELQQCLTPPEANLEEAYAKKLAL